MSSAIAKLLAAGGQRMPDGAGVLAPPDTDGTIHRVDDAGKVVEIREVYDTGWEEWAALFGKTEADYRWFLNHYHCPCGEEWDDEHSCTCNDRCPKCNAEIEPFDSEDLSPTHEETTQETPLSTSTP